MKTVLRFQASTAWYKLNVFRSAFLTHTSTIINPPFLSPPFECSLPGEHACAADRPTWAGAVARAAPPLVRHFSPRLPFSGAARHQDSSTRQRALENCESGGRSPACSSSGGGGVTFERISASPEWRNLKFLVRQKTRWKRRSSTPSLPRLLHY